MAEISFKSSKQRRQSSQKREMCFSKPMKRDRFSDIVRSDVTLLQERSLLVEPEDLEQLTYNDVAQISRNRTDLNNYIAKVRLNMKSLQQRNKRLEQRATDLKSIVAFLKNRIVAKDSAAFKM
ncbi:uncharacterized protein LOC105685671 isoform X2 [Athalia rosae]|nr:uncharacterized protein LOC105685671 isoform X2 [Athalia rosae]